ncbi:MAG: LPS assembly lipoprotein LptE [Acetobacteraceae bacterium]
MRPLGRRRLLGIATGLALTSVAGCGFQPVYMPTASGSPGPAVRELATIHVALIPDRPGQLLRQALQQRLHGTDEGGERRYDLGVFFWITGEGIAILPDNTNTFTRLTAHANWALVARDTARTTIATGTARSYEGIDTFDTQYFAGDLSNEQVTARLAQQIADQITLRLATVFRARAG